MNRRPPDHRARAILASDDASAWTDPRESALFHFVKTGGREVIIADVEDAYGVYFTPEYRHVVDALLLAKASDGDVCSALDLAPNVLSVYRHLFFDRSVFNHALEAHTYANTVPCSDKERQHYLTAVMQGPAALFEQFRIGERPPPDVKSFMREVMADLMVGFRQHRGQDISSPIAQAAFRLAPEILRYAASMSQAGPGARAEEAAKAIRLALKVEEEVDETVDTKQIAGF